MGLYGLVLVSLSQREVATKVSLVAEATPEQEQRGRLLELMAMV